MNTKKSKGIIGITLAIIMIASIFAAINPVPVLASPDEVTVDGDRGEWLPAWKIYDDPDDPWNNGYDLLEVYNRRSTLDNKFYVMFVVDGIGGDSDGDGSPHTVNDNIADQTGVGTQETYVFALNLDNNVATGTTVHGQPGYDLTIVYNNNMVADNWYGSYTEPAGFVATATIKTTTPYTDAIEFSITNASYLFDTTGYVFFGYVGSAMDGTEIPEDEMEQPIEPEEEPPEVNFTWDQICCRTIEFDGSASDANITNYTWYFGDGATEDGTGTPGVTNHTYAESWYGGTPMVKLEGCTVSGACGNLTDIIYIDRGPTAEAWADPICFSEGNDTLITFYGNNSHADELNTYDPRSIVWQQWTFDDGLLGTSDGQLITSRIVNDTVTATLEVSDGCCNRTIDVELEPCSQCKLRLYGTYGEGAGDHTSSATDLVSGLMPENKPYTDPVGPFFPQHEQAPRKDFITFNPAIMNHNEGYSGLSWRECTGNTTRGDVEIEQEKVLKRMWYEKDWFKDENKNGKWDVVTSAGVMTLAEWNAIPAWKRPSIREWNSPLDGLDPEDLPPGWDWEYNASADIYGPAIVQEFTYMFLDQHTNPIMIENGSTVLIPIAHDSDPSNPFAGLNSFDADGDGLFDYVNVESEATLGMDIDQDGILEPMDADFVEVSGDETIVFTLEKILVPGQTMQFFDHKITFTGIWDTGNGAEAQFTVCDNEGGIPSCDPNVILGQDDTAFFRRAAIENDNTNFYLTVITPNLIAGNVKIGVGRMFGQTYANIGGTNLDWNQKAFFVDGVFYNVVAIKAVDNCTKYITFRQKLPKMPIKLYGKHLTTWAPEVTLPEMAPFSMTHEILEDVNAIDPRSPPYPIVKVPTTSRTRPALKIEYVDETEELRYKGTLKEIYNETRLSEELEYWNEEWFWTLPWQYTEFLLPKGEKYLVTLSWIANESAITLWDNIPDGPQANWTESRVKFWYEDCSGPLYIDRDTESIRLYGIYGEGAGNKSPALLDPVSRLTPENKPYTDPVGPFYPQHEEAPVKDFMTFNPAIMNHNDGYTCLYFRECAGGSYYEIEIPQEKVLKRMWYEKDWFKDENKDGSWNVVIQQYNPTTEKWEDYTVMTLAEWNAIPDHTKLINKWRIREWNSPTDGMSSGDSTIIQEEATRLNSEEWEYNGTADIYGPAVVQEFTYMFLDQHTMPIMIRDGSKVLIPMAHQPGTPYSGLNSFDAIAGDGITMDCLSVESEGTLGLDIDQDGTLEPMGDSTELNGDETIVFVFDKTVEQGQTLQLFDYNVDLYSVAWTGSAGEAWLKVYRNDGVDTASAAPMTTLGMGETAFFRMGREDAANTNFYITVRSLDVGNERVLIEVGRMFGQTYANIGGTNLDWNQKAFFVDGVFYNVVAIKAVDNCTKYITFRQKLPKLPIKLYGNHLETWRPGETLPEMAPFSMEHYMINDVQTTWVKPLSQQDKIGPKIAGRPALNITWVEENEEWRFLGELKEIYNETSNETEIFWNETEYWNAEWFHTQPKQWTSFRIRPLGEKYLMTLAWESLESEMTLWDDLPDGPQANWTGSRVKFWYDPADNTDIYINRISDEPEEEQDIATYYDLNLGGTNGHGNGDGIIDSAEVIDAVMDYLNQVYPFGTDGLFTKNDLIVYILTYLAP